MLQRATTIFATSNAVASFVNLLELCRVHGSRRVQRDIR